MVIDHIGIVVKDINQALMQWESVFGYKQMTKIVENSLQKVKVTFLNKKDSITVKLVQPTDETSPVFPYSKKGGGLHHLCFKCDNLESKLEELTEKKLRILSYPQPGEAFENEKIAFIFVGNGLNIELIDTDKKTGRI